MVEIVLGPPGTGKTTTLMGIARDELARGVPPDRLGYLSFTRRAAEEARDRAGEALGLAPSQMPYFRTLHSMCFRVLGLGSGDVLEGRKLVDFGDWARTPVTALGTRDEGTVFGYEFGDRCLHMDNLARVSLRSLRQQYEVDHDELDWFEVDRVSRALAQYKTERGLVDFTDMLQMVADSAWSPGLEVVLIDEAQDLSLLQWRVVHRISRGARRVVLVGDDDQAIYRWAGAAVEHFVGMPGDVRVLEQSWRVPAEPQRLAGEVVGRVRERRPKAWRARQGSPGAVRRASDLDDVELGPQESTLILSRNIKFLEGEVLPSLRQDGIWYEYRGRSAVAPETVGAILSWERLRRGEPVPAGEVRRVVRLMTAERGVARGHEKLPSHPDDESPLTLETLRREGVMLRDDIWHDALDRIPAEDRAYMTRALRRGDRLTEAPKLRVSTIHGSKGGQADHVVLLTDMATRTYREMGKEPEDEHRCYYVGVTRAKERLTIVRPHTKRFYDL